MELQIEDFIQKIETEFEEIKTGTIRAGDEFRKLEGWSSMMALILIAKVDSEYNITISADELAKCFTIRDLYELIKQKVE